MPDSLRIAFFGGGFDPVHNGHLNLARTAVASLRLDKVIYMPSGGAGEYKFESNLASSRDRLRMLDLAIEGNPHFEISRYEIDQGRFCFTIDTLRRMRERYPAGTEIILLVGGDWKNKLSTWKEGNRIAREFKVAIFPRPGFDRDADKETNGSVKNIFYFDMPPVNVSSTEIRERVRQGLSIREHVPEAVRSYIEEHNLYR